MNTYLLVLGVKVSGYIQYTGIKIIRGITLDNAFNKKYLHNPLPEGVVVMEAYTLDTSTETSDGAYIETRRII